MSKHHTRSRLSCTGVDFLEVDFPQTIAPRLVLQFSEGISIVSGQQSPSRIFAILLASLAKMLTTYGTYATAVAGTSMGVDSAARAFSQLTGRRDSSSSAGGLCMSFSNTQSK
jgi:hypothetical protein